MTQQDTVFISYRRSVSAFIARAVFMDLKANGYDVFMDVESINAGAFDTILMRQIPARTHFVVILTPGSVERCQEIDDWFRREIEQAISTGRNIVPLLVNGFDFTASAPYLTGKLMELSRYNAIRLYHDYFDEGLARLRSRYLQPPDGVKTTPAPEEDREFVQERVEAISNRPQPTESQLAAEELYAQAFLRQLAGDLNSAIDLYTRAITQNTIYSAAYNNRGNVYADIGDMKRAIADYDMAIRLESSDPHAFYNRGLAHFHEMDVEKALHDFSEAIRLKPDYVLAYNNRANVKWKQGNLQGAMTDYHAALRIDPDHMLVQQNLERLQGLLG